MPWRHRQALSDRGFQRELFDGFCSILQWVGGRDRNGKPLLSELVLRALECSQRLRAVRTPVTSVDEDDSPGIFEDVRQGQLTVCDGVHGERWEHIAAIQDEDPCLAIRAPIRAYSSALLASVSRAVSSRATSSSCPSIPWRDLR